MRKVFSIIIFCIFFNANSQKFVELDSTNTVYRFPKLVYSEKPKVAEKVNIILQIDNLLDLADKDPYAIITNRCSVKKIFEYLSWVDLSKHPNILSVKMNGLIGKKEKFVFYHFFDKRTGDAFILSDLFSENKFKTISKETPDIKEDSAFEIDKDSLYIKTDKKLKYALEELKPHLSDYGINLLFKSDTILKRNSLRQKIMRGTGKNYSGDKMVYKIYISDLDNKGNATVHYWNDKYKGISTYTDASIKNGILQADTYYYDSFNKEKVHGMYSLHLKKQENKTWIGNLQLGSPFYKLTFKEY